MNRCIAIAAWKTDTFKSVTLYCSSSIKLNIKHLTTLFIMFYYIILLYSIKYDVSSISCVNNYKLNHSNRNSYIHDYGHG